MAEKISTLILKVDLECYRCYKEIRRILCKLQDKENIRTISYEEKSNTVIISGPFDPQKLSKKLRCKARKVIKDIQIKESVKEKPKEAKPAESTPPKEKEMPKEAKPAKQEKEKPKPSEPPKEEKQTEKEDKPAEKPKKEDNPKPTEQEKKASEKEENPKPAEPEKKPEPKPEPAKNEPIQVTTTQPVFELVCCPAPYYEGYYGGCRCCACGRVSGLVVGPTYGGPGACGPVPYGPVYDGCRVYHFFSEEDPSTASCYVM